MDNESAIEIIRLDAKIEQTARLIKKLGYMPALIDEVHELQRIKNELYKI